MKQKMFYGASHIIFANANSLRKRTTEAEKVLWNCLRGKFEGFRFRRQHPLSLYIADFYCHKAKLVIELDGNIHDVAAVKENDIVRQRIIEEDGIKVIRFSNEDVLNDIEKVLGKIRANLKPLNPPEGDLKDIYNALIILRNVHILFLPLVNTIFKLFNQLK